jgi:DNA-binding beta-propeller fold protein YncE
MTVYAYITNNGDGTVSQVDTSGVVQSVNVGTGVHSGPFGVAATADGSVVYTANNGDGTVSAIDTSNPASLSVSTFISGLSPAPTGIAVSPDGSRIILTFDAGTPIQVYDASGTLLASISLGVGDTIGVACSPDNLYAYVAANQDNEIGVISLQGGTPALIATIALPTGAFPYGIAVSPNGTKLYVTDNGSSGKLWVINPLTKAVGYIPSVGAGAGVTFLPNGKYAYVALFAALVAVIDATDDTELTTISLTNNPIGISATPDSSTVYVATQSGVYYIDTSTNTATGLTYTPLTPTAFGQFIQPSSVPMSNIPYAAPQGRLTLTSNTPVMTSDVTSATNVYYTPYVGNIVPIYDGANMQSYTFSQLTMALNSTNQTVGNIYDLFVFLNGGNPTIGAGPKWSTAPATSGSSANPCGGSRGTGASTTQLQMTDGIWTNANSINLTNGATTYSSIPAGEATYVGSVYIPTTAGETAVQFYPTAATGGTDNVVGIWNAYNRIRMESVCSDSRTGWPNNSATVVPLDYSAGGGTNLKNSVSYLDGLAQTFARGKVQTIAYSNAAATNCQIGVAQNSTTTYSKSSVFINAVTSPAGFGATTFNVEDNYPPTLGLNYIQGLESSPNAPTTVTFAFNGGETSVVYDGEF